MYLYCRVQHRESIIRSHEIKFIINKLLKRKFLEPLLTLDSLLVVLISKITHSIIRD